MRIKRMNQEVGNKIVHFDSVNKYYFKLIAKPAMSIAKGRSGLQPVDQLATLPCSSRMGLSNRTPPTKPTGQTEAFLVDRI